MFFVIVMHHLSSHSVFTAARCINVHPHTLRGQKITTTLRHFWQTEPRNQGVCLNVYLWFTELLTDEVLCVCVVLPAQDGPYWPLQADTNHYNQPSITTSNAWFKNSTRCVEPVYLHGLWDLVDVLRFDDGPQVVLQDFGEVVLQLRTSEVGQDLLPVWRILAQKTQSHVNKESTWNRRDKTQTDINN